MEISPFKPSESRKARRVVTKEDIRLYRAITGKSAELDDCTPKNCDRPAAPRTIATIAKRVLAPDVAQLSVRLREICEMGIAHGVKRPQMADWLRHMSDEAFRRLDQAQTRLSQARPTAPRRRVEAREISAQSAASHNLQSVA